MKYLKTPLMITALVYLLSALELIITKPSGGSLMVAVLLAILLLLMVIFDLLLRLLKNAKLRLVLNWVLAVPFMAFFILALLDNFMRHSG